MKEIMLLYLFFITAITSNCSSDKQSKDSLPYIDSQKNYPIKELILTDVAEVTYLYLNSDERDYLYNGGIRCVTENTIVVYDNSSHTVLFFSKDGKPKSRFNRKGRGGEEYFEADIILYDETTDDVFIFSSVAYADFIQVYSSVGKYKRKISVPGVSMYRAINFDEHSLLVYDLNYYRPKLYEKQKSSPIAGLLAQSPSFIFSKYDSPFLLISKIDGAIMDIIKVPERDIVLLTPEGLPFDPTRMIQSLNGIFLCNPDNDTVYLYSKDRSLTPVFYKTPPGIDSYPIVILNNFIDIGQYQFMELVTVCRENREYPIKYYFRDKQNGDIYRQKIVLPDYKGKELYIGPSKSGYRFKDGVRFNLDLLELKQDYRDNRLSGKLKELVATLKDDDNNVIVIARFK